MKKQHNQKTLRTLTSFSLLCLFLAPMFLMEAAIAQQSDKNPLFACHLRAALVNSNEAVFWSDLEPCNEALHDPELLGLSQEEHQATLLNRAILLMELTELDRARLDLEAASLIAPQSPQLNINMGLLNFLDADYEAAAESFALVLEREQQGQESSEYEELRALALYNRALAYGYLNESELALQDLRALQLGYPQLFLRLVSSEGSNVLPDLVAQLSDQSVFAEGISSPNP